MEKHDRAEGFGEGVGGVQWQWAVAAIQSEAKHHSALKFYTQPLKNVVCERMEQAASPPNTAKRYLSADCRGRLTSLIFDRINMIYRFRALVFEKNNL